jgi:sarcosine/dimethylglycine N-methyltransferase
MTSPTYAETDLANAVERLAGGDLGSLTPAQLALFDQFHAGGAEAVDRLLPGLGVAAGMTVLDVGCGFGGPARQVARALDCTVVGVDITPAYVELARALSRAAGGAEQVRFVCSDIDALDDGEFDAAYTMHVQMNVADKKAFYAAITRRLRPGARLAVFEVCRTGALDPAPPLPWSLDGTDSFLVSADELRDTIASCGLEAVEWVDETEWVRQWFDGAVSRLAAAGSRVTLPALLNDGPARMLNYAAAITNDVVSIHRGTFRRT